MQIISSLINNSPVLKQELRSQIAFPGSLNHNLTELRSLNAIELQADKTSRGLLFRLYSEVIDILERSFAETRKRQNESGIKLTVSDLMTPARSFLEAILAETVTEIIAKMTLQEVGAIIVNRGERTRKGYLLIQRLSAVRAFADGLGGQRVQALPRQYFSDPIILKGDKTIWDTAAAMNKTSIEHGIILDEHGLPVGMISNHDILGLALYHNFPPGRPYVPTRAR